MRLGPPDGYDTHWSRLIDAGLAGMSDVRQFTDAAFAERLVRTVWPMLWLLPTMAGAAAIAWRVAGPAAAPIALRADSGRACRRSSISFLAGSIITTCRSRWRCCWWRRVHGRTASAGLRLRPVCLTGAAMAIGFEGLPYMVLGGAAMALRFVVAPRGGRGARPLRRLGCGASVAAAFLVSVGPAQWGARRLATRSPSIPPSRSILATLGLALAAGCWPGRLAVRAAGVAASASRRRPCSSHRAALPCGPVRHDGPDGAIPVVQPRLGNAVAVGGRLRSRRPGGRGRRLPGGRLAVHGAHRARSGGAPAISASWWLPPRWSSRRRSC